MDKIKSNIKKNVYFLVHISIFMLIFIAITKNIYCKEISPLEKHMIKTKEAYKFDEWKGKTKIANKKINSLNIDPNFLNVLSKKIQIINKYERDKYWSLNIVDAKSSLYVDIDINVENTPISAHEALIRTMSSSSRVPPVFQRADSNDPNNPLNIGDVCFYGMWKPPKSKTTVVRVLFFCRNNVCVIIRNSDNETKEEYPDITKIAHAIDKKLIEISEPKK